MSITIIFGLPRVGKTALMTNLALQCMRGSAARQDLKSCSKLIKPLNANGFFLSAPLKHLVFSDYFIQTNKRAEIVNNEVNGFYLGLPNKSHPTVFLSPYSRIYLDEAQKYYNSRERISDFVSRFYELHGHYRLNITMAVQRPGLIDVNIRELAVEVIEVESLKHEYDHGKIVGSIWTCNVFSNAAKVQKYIDGGKSDKLGDKVRYYFEGNIFNHYDSYNFFPTFFNERYTEDFSKTVAKKCGKNLIDIKAFNTTHDYAVPETYYKSKGVTKRK